MDSRKRALLRIAVAVQERLLRPTVEPITLNGERWRAIMALMERISFCHDRGMWHAEQSQRDELRGQLNRLSQETYTQAQAIAESRLVHRKGQGPMSSLADIYHDLVTLDDEFPKATFDLRAGILSVMTEPIVLGDVQLGPFRIELQYRRIRAYDPYRVVAAKPNNPPGYPHVTHPHVEDDSLCEGNATAAIKAALESGRLHDFFLLVTQVLSNLNSDSVYVSLSKWNSIKCDDCGDAVAEDDALVCRKCGTDVCGSCAALCPQCELDYCSSCISTCDACNETCCRNCLTRCSDCQQSICPNCNKGKKCSCHNSQEPNEDEKMDEEASTHDAERDEEAQLTV